MTDEALYAIDELAERGGVSRRTVRYYVQRGLLPAPTGVGRGKHYTEAHLARLVALRELQEAGISLAEAAEWLDSDGAARAAEDAPDLSRGLSPGPVREPPGASIRGLARGPEGSWAQSTWTRISVSEDVELFVRGRRLEPARLRRLIDAVERELDEERA